MTLNQIEKQWDTGWQALAATADASCEKRVRELVAKLRHFTIHTINMGMGTWSLSGPDFKAVWDDASEGDMDLQEIVYWLEHVIGMKAGMKIWNPKGITKAELAALTELYKLCEWWVDKTGGYDVSFEAPAN